MKLTEFNKYSEWRCDHPDIPHKILMTMSNHFDLKIKTKVKTKRLRNVFETNKLGQNY